MSKEEKVLRAWDKGQSGCSCWNWGQTSLVPPSLRDRQVGRADLSAKWLGKGKCQGESQISAKACKSSKEKSLKICLFPLETAFFFFQTCWSLVPEWASSSPLYFVGLCLRVPCFVASSILSVGWSGEGWSTVWGGLGGVSHWDFMNSFFMQHAQEAPHLWIHKN